MDKKTLEIIRNKILLWGSGWFVGLSVLCMGRSDIIGVMLCMGAGIFCFWSSLNNKGGI